MAGGPPIVCLSPSPDWATTVNLKREFDAKGNAANTAGGSLTLDSESSTGNAQMAGRTAAVVALRDALYQACQASGNGVLGRAAYAVTLSQFGNILTAVLQAQGTGAAPTAPAGGDAAAAGLLQLALVQQQHVQALVVACLNTYDPSLPALAASSASPVLTQAQCQTLIGNIVAASPELLKPVLPPAVAAPAPDKPAAPDAAKPPQPVVAKPAPAAKGKTKTKTARRAAG
jgi:hypothetical protein